MKRVSAGQVLLSVFVLLLGLVIGGLGPRAQVRDLEKKLAEAEDCSGSTMGSEIANVFRGRPWEEERAEKSPQREPSPAEAPKAAPEEEGFVIQFGDGEEKDLSKMSTDEITNSLEVAREAMELRYAIAREALIQDANPSEEQLRSVDTAMEKMNDHLAELARDLADVVSSGEEPGRRETMEFAAETLDAFLAAEDDLRDVFDEDQIASMQEESLDPMSYVDPAIIDILGELNR